MFLRSHDCPKIWHKVNQSTAMCFLPNINDYEHRVFLVPSQGGLTPVHSLTVTGAQWCKIVTVRLEEEQSMLLAVFAVLI